MAGESEKSGAWEVIEALGRSVEAGFGLADRFEQGADEKGAWAGNLLYAIKADDVGAARESERGLLAAGISEKERLGVSGVVMSAMGAASGEMIQWLAKSPWMAARDKAIEDDKGAWVKNAVDELSGDLAVNGNREGLDELMRLGLVSIDEAIIQACGAKNLPLFLRYGSMALAQGIKLGEEALSGFCAAAGAMGAQSAVGAVSFPMEPYFKAWGPALAPEGRSELWSSVVDFSSALMAASLLRCGIEPEGWRAAKSRLSRRHPAEWERQEPPPLLDYAIRQGRHSAKGGAGSVFLKALLEIEPLAAQRGSVGPTAFESLSNTDLEQLAKAGVNLANADEQGRNLAHLMLSQPYYRPAVGVLVANAKRFPGLWGAEDRGGKTPQALLKKEELAPVLDALSAGEKKELSKALKGRRGSKAKPSRSL